MFCNDFQGHSCILEYTTLYVIKKKYPIDFDYIEKISNDLLLSIVAMMLRRV